MDKFLTLIAIYMASFIFAPVLSGGRDINFFGLPLMPGSLLTIIHMSLLAVLQQNYGKETAKKLVIGSLIAKAFIWSFTILTLLLPALHQDPGYEKMVVSSFRVFIAATIGRFINAYLIDIPLFEYLRNKYNKFWISFIITLLIETILGRLIFLVIAKYGTPGSLFGRFIAQTIISAIFVTILTPIISILNNMLFNKQSQTNS